MRNAHRSTSRRWVARALPALLVAVLAIVVVAPGRAATGSSCSGTITAGKASGIQLKGFGLHAVRISCSRAHTVVRDYLHTKVSQSSEKCAGQAENPGRGCKIDGYLCHSAGRVRLSHGRSIRPEACKQSGRQVRFTESDHTNG